MNDFTEAELTEMEQHVTRGGTFASDDVGRLLQILREKNIQNERLKNWLNEIRGRAWRDQLDVSGSKSEFGGWVLKFIEDDCAEKPNHDVERLIEKERALGRQVRCDCGVPGCNKLYDHRK